MDFAQYIAQNALILIPVLYVLGMIIKNTEKIDDKYIPIILLIAGIAGAVGIMGVNADAVVQGVLVTGTTVYTNQLIKQTAKKECQANPRNKLEPRSTTSKR
jgi:uncharacterized membrane protein